MTINNCSAEEFNVVKKLIKKFELDDRHLIQNQFLTLSKQNKLFGFGRIKEHVGCSEMCSLGVLEHVRSIGVGKKLLVALIEKATQPIYLVCIIPDFFIPLGFVICTEFPLEIQQKLDYCNQALRVNEHYVVMKKV